MADRPHYDEAEIAVALVAARGIKVAAARRMGCSVDTIERYVKRFPVVAEAQRQAREALCDLAESVVVQHLEAGSLDAAKWYLGQQGHTRGYGDDTPPGLARETIVREYVGVDVEAL